MKKSKRGSTPELREKCAELSVDAAAVLEGDVDSKKLFALMILFESWIIDGGDATQEKFKLLPEGEIHKLQLVKK